jgi:hypothetical protein
VANWFLPGGGIAMIKNALYLWAMKKMPDPGLSALKAYTAVVLMPVAFLICAVAYCYQRNQNEAKKYVAGKDAAGDR